MAFVTSRYTLDSKDSSARKYMAERADLLGAIRLPNNAFRANAGTDVVSDIIFLQKRDRPIDHEPDWVQLGKTEDGFAINQYFVDHPEMVLGQLTLESTQYGHDLTVAPIDGAVLADQLAEAVQHIEGQFASSSEWQFCPRDGQYEIAPCKGSKKSAGQLWDSIHLSSTV